ncbi:MAG: GAF domain-containing protein [Cyclobacteriaceae bacterium]
MSAYREIPEEELFNFHQEVYKSADRITRYFVLGYFAVGIGLSFFHNTWLIAILMGGSLTATYFLLRQYFPLNSFFRRAVGLIFWLFPLQFILQMHGDISMSFFYFVSLTVLLFYEDKYVLFPVIGSAVLTYFILFAGTVNDQFIGIPMENLPDDAGHMVLQISIMILYAVLTVLWANIQRKQTRESGINYLEMDEQLKMMEVNIAFADHISKGDLQADYPVKKADRLGESLLNMRKSLSEAAIREQKEKFVNVGMASVAELLRNHVDSLDILSDKVIEKLVSYLKANQGGFFIIEEERGNTFLELKACRAYERKKFMDRRIQIGEGLLGQAVLEKEITLMTEVPDGYLNITSGLGIASPDNLIIVPLKSNEEVIGVIELASFKEFDDTDIEFLEKVSESIASTVISAKTNQKTKELLESSRQMTEEMQAQEEEMRQNMEEMQATQEEMARTQKELAEKEANLQALINNTDDSIITIDKNYRILIMNDVVKNRYRGTQFEHMKEGDNALDMLGDVSEEWKGYYDRVLAGEQMNFVLKSSVHGEDTWREYFLNPMLDEHKDIIGLSVFSRDITETKKAQQQLAHEKALFQAFMDNMPDAIY